MFFYKPKEGLPMTPRIIPFRLYDLIFYRYGATRLGVFRLWGICTLFFLTVPCSGWSQHPLSELDTGRIGYSQLVRVDGVAKEEIHLRAKKWCHDAFSHFSNNMLREEEEQGPLAIKAGFPIRSFPYEGQVFFSTTISVGDGICQIVFTDFKFQDRVLISYHGRHALVPFGPPVDFEKLPVGLKRRLKKKANMELQVLVSDLQLALSLQPFYSHNDW
jgi:hypothetical protein